MMIIEKHGKDTANSFPSPPSELRYAIVNFVKILLILTFLPIGTTDQLGKENNNLYELKDRYYITKCTIFDFCISSQ